MSSAQPLANDATVIANTIRTYINGGIAGSSDVMKPAFHANATIHGYIGSDLFGGPIQLLFEWIDSNPPAPDLKCEIADITVQVSVATARIECENWGGHRFTDMFMLLKTDGAWEIVSKVFYLHPEE